MFLYKEILPELRQHFKFHSHLLRQVETWKQMIREAQNKTVIFVGVHCRRTDYGDHLAMFGSSMVDHRFFDTAFDMYRRKYNDENNKVIFLAVSDDSARLKTNLGRHPDVRFGCDYSKDNVAQGEVAGWDLCVLATSHHSVHTYGTFGLWGALLAGGDVVVAKGRNQVTLFTITINN